MTLTTMQISQIKALDDNVLMAATNTTHFKHIAATINRLDTGWKPETRPHRRTKQIYDSIRIRGWNPEQHEYIQAYQWGKHVILWSGTHRIAVLTHLGHTHVTIQIQEKKYLYRGLW